MPEVRIGTPDEHLTLVAESGTGAPELLDATLKSSGLSATTPVAQHYATGFGDLADFFAGLGRDWRGWDGVRAWESLEGELTIEARHQFGRVRLTVTVRNQRTDWGHDGWHATADLSIEPGEQLSYVVQETAALASGAK